MVINLNNRANVHEEYIDALGEERRKIQVFQRELPLCLQLVTQAIDACKQQLTSGGNGYNFDGQSESSEQTSSEGPVLEKFIPFKKLFLSSDDDEEEKQYKKAMSNNNEINSMNNNNKASKNSGWLRSAQLWNQSPDPTTKEDSPKVVQVVEVKRGGSGGAFHPFKGEKSGGGNKEVVAATAAVASTSADTGESCGGRTDKSKKQEKEKHSQRKQRRSWSPELHKKFLNALQQLGGSHAATPKQIKELMSVDGLTNDEVKSHLQKYRLHTRRPNTRNNNNDSPQTRPQFVVVGGLWMQSPPEHTPIDTTPTSAQDGSVSSK